MWFRSYVLHYCIGLGQSSFWCLSGQRSVAGQQSVMHMPFHVVIVLLSVAVGGIFRFWSSFLVFSPFLLSLCFNSLFISICQYMYFYIHYYYCCLHYYLLLLLFPLSWWLFLYCDGWLGLGWQAGLMVGLWVGQAFRMFLLPGFGVSSSSPWVPGHPTSMCDSGVKHDLSNYFESSFQKVNWSSSIGTCKIMTPGANNTQTTSMDLL